LSNIYNYGYTNSFCSNDTNGFISFVPELENLFFVLVSQTIDFESSYGKDSNGFERPEAIGIGTCKLPQNLSNICDSLK